MFSPNSVGGFPFSRRTRAQAREEQHRKSRFSNVLLMVSLGRFAIPEGKAQVLSCFRREAFHPAEGSALGGLRARATSVL